MWGVSFVDIEYTVLSVVNEVLSRATAMDSGEKQPLLSSGVPAQEQPPPYEQPTIPSFVPDSNGTAPEGQQPPPYASVNASGGMTGQTMFVQCRVCQHVIHVSSESHTRVVKCSNCREATVRQYIDILDEVYIIQVRICTLLGCVVCYHCYESDVENCYRHSLGTVPRSLVKTLTPVSWVYMYI